MPVLYYLADTSKIRYSEEDAQIDAPYENIYNIFDNLDLVNMKVPWFGSAHPMSDGILVSLTRTGADPAADQRAEVRRGYTTEPSCR